MKLSSAPDSILTYDHNGWKNTTEDTSPRDPLVYSLPLYAKHSGQVGNTTSPHRINIVYRYSIENNDSANDLGFNNIAKLETFSFPLSMPVMTMDFSSFVYLFIVFIGVLVSRYTKKIYSSMKESQELTPEEKLKQNSFNQQDLVWIFASGIITLLIFSSFQEQVDLRSSLIVNISLAFTFGFGFDKLIETASLLGKSK